MYTYIVYIIYIHNVCVWRRTSCLFCRQSCRIPMRRNIVQSCHAVHFEIVFGVGKTIFWEVLWIRLKIERSWDGAWTGHFPRMRAYARNCRISRRQLFAIDCVRKPTSVTINFNTLFFVLFCFTNISTQHNAKKSFFNNAKPPSYKRLSYKRPSWLMTRQRYLLLRHEIYCRHRCRLVDRIIINNEVLFLYSTRARIDLYFIV